MLLRLLFIFGLNVAVHSVGAVPVQSNFIPEALISSHAQREQSLYNEAIRDKEASVQQMRNKWNSCRTTCKASCRTQCVGGSSLDHQNCLSSCTDEKCDSGQCYAQKLNYETHKKKLDDMNQSQNEFEKSKQEPESNSPLRQVQSKKKKTNLLAYVGVGTTAFLGYKAKTTCSSCCWTSHPSCCGQCSILIGMATAAGVQTATMFQKKDELGRTADAMCSTANDPSCQSEDGGSEEKDEDFDLGLVGGCQLTSTQQCIDTYLAVNPPEGECPPDQPNCKSQQSLSGPDMPGGGYPGGFGSLTGNDDFSNRLGNAFKPKGGWPNGENPFVGTERFDYNKLSPKQKKMADSVMADLNKKNKAFLDKHGLSSPSEGMGGTAGESMEIAGGLDGKGAGSSSGVPAKFQEMADGSRSIAGSEDNTAGRGKPKTNSIAEQMQDMLKKMHGMADGSKGGSGHLGDKSVLVGNDNVGVREDNIFMMVHRMNRKLDGQSRFIGQAGF